jgi:GNAT superfamily N-acetyltransferase
VAVGFVRQARAGDAGEIARIQLTTWRVAYERLLPRHVLDQMDEEFLKARWLESIEAPPTPQHRVLVAIEQAVTEYVAGFMASEPSDTPGSAMITEMLVEPRWGRRGHGSRLLSASADLWRADGFDAAEAWVFEQDPATNKFLSSAGWGPDGSGRALDVDDLLVPQLRLHTSLSDSPSEQTAEADGESRPADH